MKISRGPIAAGTFLTAVLAALPANAASFSAVIEPELIAEQWVFDLSTLSEPLLQYAPGVDESLTRVTLSLQGTLTATTSVSDLPRSPLSTLFSLQGTVRLLAPDDTVLFSTNSLQTETVLLETDALPVNQTLTLGLPPTGLPDTVVLDAEDVTVEQFFIGESALPLRLVVTAEPRLSATESLDAVVDTVFGAQLTVTYETRSTAPTTVPEPGVLLGLLVSCLGLGAAARQRRGIRCWKTAC